MKANGTPYKTTLARRQAVYRYQKTSAGQEAMLRYRQSDAGRESQRRYRLSEKGKATNREKYRRYYAEGRSYTRRKPKARGTYIRRIQVTVPILIIAERDGDSIHAYAPLFKGLHTQGSCINSAVANAKLAAQAYIESLIKHGEPIPTKSPDADGGVGYER